MSCPCQVPKDPFHQPPDIDADNEYDFDADFTLDHWAEADQIEHEACQGVHTYASETTEAYRSFDPLDASEIVRRTLLHVDGNLEMLIPCGNPVGGEFIRPHEQFSYLTSSDAQRWLKCACAHIKCHSIL